MVPIKNIHEFWFNVTWWIIHREKTWMKWDEPVNWSNEWSNDFLIGIPSKNYVTKLNILLDVLPIAEFKAASCRIAVTISDTLPTEWGWTARIAIAQHAIARHFWQEINCSTRNWQTARIQLILAKLDSSKRQKSDNCSTVSSNWNSIFCDSKM